MMLPLSSSLKFSMMILWNNEVPDVLEKEIPVRLQTVTSKFILEQICAINQLYIQTLESTGETEWFIAEVRALEMNTRSGSSSHMVLP